MSSEASNIITAVEAAYIMQCMLKPDRVSHIPINLSIRGPLDVERLSVVLNRIVNKHQSLRTSFRPLLEDATSIAGKFERVVALDFSVSLGIKDISDASLEQQKNLVQQQIAIESLRSFDISKLPLFNFEILKVSSDYHELFLTIHHVIFDGWSVDIFLNEIEKEYAFDSVEVDRKSIACDSGNLVQFSDYLDWYKSALLSPSYNKNFERYWEKYINEIVDYRVVRDIEYEHEKKLSFNSHRCEFNIPVQQKPNQFFSSYGVSYATVLMSAYALALSVFNKNKYVYMINVTSGRMVPRFNDVIGIFVSAVFAKVNIDMGLSAVSLMKGVQDENLRSMFYSLEGIPPIISCLAKKSLIDEDYLWNESKAKVVFNFEGYDLPEESLPRRIRSDISYDLHTSNNGDYSFFDLELHARASDKSLYGYLSFWKDFYIFESADKITKIFNYVLAGILSNPEVIIRDLLDSFVEDRI